MRKDEGSRGWVIVAACFFLGLICDVLLYSYGLLFVEFLDEFKQSETTTAWIGSIFFGWYLVGPVVSTLIKRFGCRPAVLIGAASISIGCLCSTRSTSVQFLYFSHGFLGGLGYLLGQFARDVIIVQYFEKRRSLAMGISVCGSGIGMIVSTQVTQWLIDEYSWRGALLIIGGLELNCFACGLVMKPFTGTTKQMAIGLTPESRKSNVDSLSTSHAKPDKYSCIKSPDLLVEEDTPLLKTSGRFGGFSADDPIVVSKCVKSDDGNNQISKDTTKKSKLAMNLSLLKRPKLVILLVAMFAISIGYSTPFTFIPDMVVRKGWSRAQAAWVITVIGIVNTICRIPIGKLGDLNCVNRIFLLAVCHFVMAASVAIMPWLDDYDYLLLASAFFGVAIAMFIVLHQVAIADLFLQHSVTDVYGMTFLVAGIAGPMNGPFAGGMFDATGDFKLAFAASGVVIAFSGLLVLVLFVISKKERRPL